MYYGALKVRADVHCLCVHTHTNVSEHTEASLKTNKYILIIILFPSLISCLFQDLVEIELAAFLASFSSVPHVVGCRLQRCRTAVLYLARGRTALQIALFGTKLWLQFFSFLVVRRKKCYKYWSWPGICTKLPTRLLIFPSFRVLCPMGARMR